MPPLSAAGQRLARQSAFLSRPLDLDQLGQLEAYLELLLRWNQRIRLVGPRDPDTLVDEHLVDALRLAEGLVQTMSATASMIDPRSAETHFLVDVGSGAGLPGLVLAVVLPDLDVTLCEPSEKRCSFLHEARRLLGLRFGVFEHPVATLQERRPHAFDHAVCRATFEPEVWAPLGAGLVRDSGSVWFMLAQRRLAPDSPGMETHYSLPGGKTRTLARWIVQGTEPPKPCFT